MEHVSIDKKATIGQNVRIGLFTRIYSEVVIGDNVTIGDNCTIGHPFGGTMSEPKLIIGPGSIVRSHSVLYQGSNFEHGIETGHHVLVRENTQGGKNLRLGSFCDIEGDCQIGDYVRCHSYVHIGKGSIIGSFVWLYSLVTLTNDPLPPSHIERPVVLEDGAVVCVGSTVLPGTVMRKGAFATSGSLVRGEVPMGMVISGENSRIKGHVSDLMNVETRIGHPWMFHFADKYPADAQDALRRLGEEIRGSKPRRGKAVPGKKVGT